MTERAPLPFEMKCPNSTGGHDMCWVDGNLFARCRHCDYATTAGALLAEYQGLLLECVDYMKERETPAQCIARNRQDAINTLKDLAKVIDRAAKAEAENAALLERMERLREALEEMKKGEKGEPSKIGV